MVNMAYKQQGQEIQEEDKIALFNAAFGATIRINSMLDACARMSANNEPVKLNKALEGFQTEIYTRMNEEAKKYSDNKFDDIYKKHLKDFINTESMDGPQTPVPRELMKELNKLEKYLRAQADKAHMLIPNKQDVLDMFSTFGTKSTK